MASLGDNRTDDAHRLSICSVGPEISGAFHPLSGVFPSQGRSGARRQPVNPTGDRLRTTSEALGHAGHVLDEELVGERHHRHSGEHSPIGTEDRSEICDTG